jgi:hypothetical protein
MQGDPAEADGREQVVGRHQVAALGHLGHGLTMQ